MINIYGVESYFFLYQKITLNYKQLMNNVWVSEEYRDRSGLSYTGNWRYISFSYIFLFPIFLFLRMKLLIFLPVAYVTSPEKKNILRAKNIFFSESQATDCRLINCHEPISYLHPIAHILMKNKRWFIKDTTNIDCHTFFFHCRTKKTEFKIVKWMQSK